MAIGKILVVDDEPGLRQTLVDFLQISQFQVTEAASLAQMWRSLRQDGSVDLILLDLNLPDGDGLHTCQTIRSDFDCGIIIMTGRDDQFDKVLGLETGADDYICKPFELRELLARIRSVLRRVSARFEPVERKRYRFGDWTFDPSNWRLVSEDAGAVQLTQYEALLLGHLLEDAGRPVSRDFLVSSLSGHSHQPFDRSVDNLVSRLRRKLAAKAGGPFEIKAARGVGYQFLGEVRVELMTRQ